MIRRSDGKQQSGFSRWLRTGRGTPEAGAGCLEVKFNPWHDPADGRFTHSGSGRHYGAGGGSADGGDRAPGLGGRDRTRSEVVSGHGASPAKPQWRMHGSLGNGSSGVRPRSSGGVRPGSAANPVGEFVGGFGEGLHDVATGTVSGLRDALTTTPTTTMRNAGLGLARMIDNAVAADGTPAGVQISRALDTVASASARDIGRATGSVAGNVALAATPGVALARVSAARSLRAASRRPSFQPPQIGWVKETSRSTKPWKLYNDATDGARPGLAPTLMRTMPDGSKRPVKFDGVRGDYVIDRKMKVVDRPRARAQLLRQSDVLSQHRLIGTWEVPTPAQTVKARKLFRKMKVTNMHVRVVKP